MLNSSLFTKLGQNYSVVRNKKLFNDATKDEALLPPSDTSANTKVLVKRLTALSSTEIVRLNRDKESMGRDINSYSAQLRDLKKRLKTTEEAIEKKKDSINPDNFYKQLVKIADKLPIVHIRFVEPGTVVFTTALFRRNKNILGAFQIWIDFCRNNYSSGIRIRNIYCRNGSYDHPCISDTSLCMGNSAETLKKLYESYMIYDLVEALISFIISDDIHNGYIRSWSTWWDGVQKRKDLDLNHYPWSPNGIDQSVLNFEKTLEIGNLKDLELKVFNI